MVRGQKRKVVNCDKLEFESAAAAARYYNVDKVSIYSSIKYGTKSSGFRWRYSDKEFTLPKTSYKRIIVRGDNVEYFSLKEAAIQNDCNDKSIRTAIKNSNKCKGFTWIYKHARSLNNVEIEGELWKPHPSLPIQVSDLGRIHNIRRSYGSNTPQGYMRIGLLNSFYRVHRLVAETFIPNSENLPQVDHIDGDKTK